MRKLNCLVVDLVTKGIDPTSDHLDHSYHCYLIFILHQFLLYHPSIERSIFLVMHQLNSAPRHTQIGLHSSLEIAHRIVKLSLSRRVL